ncbi:MAG: hypothetical protein Ct9H300mP7_4650 [Verrucomicrobiota bacterium]|nr:MAG: hypothetical protein Ct9H300mP7_4650 [Verrucomicrobiota bacterium]
MLSRTGSEEHSANLIRGWLFKEHKQVMTFSLWVNWDRS